VIIDSKLKDMGFDEDFIKYSLSSTKLKDKEVTEAKFLFQNLYPNGSTQSFTIKLMLNHPLRKSASHTFLCAKFDREIRDHKLNKILNEE
jgi:hypothetical protein